MNIDYQLNRIFEESNNMQAFVAKVSTIIEEATGLIIPTYDNLNGLMFFTNMLTEQQKSNVANALKDVQFSFEKLISSVDNPDLKQQLLSVWKKLMNIATTHELTGIKKHLPSDVGSIYVSADIDNLKQLNNNVGYAVADKVINAAAKLLGQVADSIKGDLIHPHGDEFYIIAPIEIGVDGIRSLLKGLKNASNNLGKQVFDKFGEKTGITSGVGISSEDAEDAAKISKHYMEKGGPRISEALKKMLSKIHNSSDIIKKYKPEPNVLSRLTAGPRRRAALLARSGKKPGYKERGRDRRLRDIEMGVFSDLPNAERRSGKERRDQE